MDPDDDPVVGFARAAQTMAETQQILAQTTQRIEATNQYIAETQRLALRTLRGLAWIQGVACFLLGGMLALGGYLVWQHGTHSAEHAALLQGLRADTQTLAAQTQALLETLRRTPERSQAPEGAK